MNTQLFTLSILEILVSVIVSIAIFYASYKILHSIFLKKDIQKENNIALSIFISGVFLSIGIILSEIFPSISNIIRLSNSQSQSIDLSIILTYSAIYLFIGFILAIFLNTIVFLLFSILTKGVNEFTEIKNNNVAVSILVVTLLLSITLIVKNSIALLISSLIPYPEVSNFL